MDSRVIHSRLIPTYLLKDNHGAFFIVKDSKGKVGIFTEFVDVDTKLPTQSLLWLDPNDSRPLIHFQQVNFPTPEAGVAAFRKWTTLFSSGVLPMADLASFTASLNSLANPSEFDMSQIFTNISKSETNLFDPTRARDIYWLMRWYEITPQTINSAFAKVKDKSAQKLLQLLKDYEGGSLLLPGAIGRAAHGHVKRHHIPAVKSVIEFYEWDGSWMNVRLFKQHSAEEKEAFYNATVESTLTKLKQAMGQKEVDDMHDYGDLYKILKIVAKQTRVNFFEINLVADESLRSSLDA